LVGVALSLLVALGVSLALAPETRAQTPLTTVENDAGDTRMQLNYDGGLYVPGTFNPTSPADSIPATGAGTRLMWYPAKAAFRAGLVSGTQWDASNVGDYSVAFGFDTEASGLAATAIGGRTTASGVRATALGYNTTAATDESLSIGTCNSANSGGTGEATLFAVGNGLFDPRNDECNRSDALVLDLNGNLTISGSLSQSSDRRLKTGIEPVGDDVLGRLSEIRPVRFQFKNERTHPAGEQIGLVAQDVQKEFPALVSEGAGGYLSLAYPKLTAVLVKGLQEQQDRLQQKQSRIEEHERRIARQDERIDQLEKRLAQIEAERAPMPAGWSGGALAALLLGLGGLGVGLLWRR
jgi:hypothetical protein